MNYIDIFLEALSAEKGRSQQTLTAYASDLNQAHDVIGDLLSAKNEDIQNFEFKFVVVKKELIWD